MSLESKVTQEFNIKFMDARELITEARLNLDITGGYPNSDQKQMILIEARRLYRSMPETKKIGMSLDKQSLDEYIIRSSSHSNGAVTPAMTTGTTPSTVTSAAASSKAVSTPMMMMSTSNHRHHHNDRIHHYDYREDNDEVGSCGEDSLFSD